MIKVYYHWVQVSYPDPLHPIFLALITSFYFCGCYFHINGINLYAPIVSSHLHWHGVWINFIYHIGKSTEELCAPSCYQRYCTKPNNLKGGKVRRPRLPFFKRILHIKIIALNKFVTLVGSSCFLYLDGWTD